MLPTNTEPEAEAVLPASTHSVDDFLLPTSDSGFDMAAADPAAHDGDSSPQRCVPPASKV